MPTGPPSSGNSPGPAPPRPEIIASITAEVPEEASAVIAQLLDARQPTTPAELLDRLGTVQGPLVQTQAQAIDALLARAKLPQTQVLVVGLGDSGLWSHAKAFEPCYLPLSDPARLAERTGLNVIDAFAARDLARGGLGGPILPLAQWVLLGDPYRNRLLVDLGRTIRLVYLPREPAARAADRVVALDVGPGMDLLDRLTHQFTGGEHTFDPGGRLAVQGHRIAELAEHWQTDPYFDTPLPRWSPHGVSSESFHEDALRLAHEHAWRGRDILCTATHFLAESLRRTAYEFLKNEPPIDEMIVCGGGQHSGMLLGLIAQQFSDSPMHRLGDLGLADAALEPACYAVLAMAHLDQTPANLPRVTGADLSRVLGRLTPGSPQSWQHLLCVVADAHPTIRPLRGAL